MVSLGIRTGGLSTQSFGWLAKKHHLTESEVRDLDHRYKIADLDRSGQLDKNELKVLLKSTVASAASEAGLTKFLDSQWHNVDRDGNGTVDFDEFLNLYGVLKATGGPNAQAAKKAATTTTTKPATGAADAKGKGAATTAAPKAKGAKAPLGVRRQRKPKTKATKKIVRRQTSFTPSGKLTEQNYVTHEVAWAAIRNQHAFLVKRGGVTLSGEKGNLRNIHSRYHSGLTSNRTVDISNVPGGLNLRLNAPSNRRLNQPARQYTNAKFVRDNRGVARQFKNQLKNYRKSTTNAALARMSRLKASAPDRKRTPNVRSTRRAAAAASTSSQSASTTTAAATTQTPTD